MFISSKLSEIWNSSHGQKGADGDDTFLVRECLMSKMGELLAKDRADLVKSLQKRGININPKSNDNILLDVVFDQIRRSEDYATEIVRMLLKKEGVSKADGRLVSDSSFLLKKIAENGTNAKRIVREYKNQWIYGDDEAKKLYADNSGNDIDKELVKWSTGRVLVAIGILGGLGYLGYRLWKKRKSNASIEGEEVTDVENIESIE